MDLRSDLLAVAAEAQSRLRYRNRRRWPVPPPLEGDDPPLREVDHGDDDPGPAYLIGPELRRLSEEHE